MTALFRQFPEERNCAKEVALDPSDRDCGDLKVTAAGNQVPTTEIPNVIFVDRKVHAIEKLIAVRPDRTS